MPSGASKSGENPYIVGFTILLSQFLLPLHSEKQWNLFDVL